MAAPLFLRGQTRCYDPTRKPGRIRIKLQKKRMTLQQADLLEKSGCKTELRARQVSIHERTCCIILYYDGSRQTVLDDIRRFLFPGRTQKKISLPAHSSRALNRNLARKNW